jgi:aryl-alcohol dehydrogenase-like predicted oxidoreductase
LIKKYRNYLSEIGLTPIEAAIGFAIGVEDVDTVLIGVNNHQQLEQIIAGARTPLDPKLFAEFAVAERSVVDPSTWQF